MKSYHLIIKGRVQGVFFRSNVKKRARSLNLKGYVKNLASGNVEVLVQGEKENIKQLIDYCKKGPALAKVKHIEMQKTEAEEFSDFTIEY